MRAVVRLITALAGLIALAAGVLLIVEAIGAWASPGTGGVLVPWSSAGSAMRGLSWQDLATRLAAGAAVLLGLILLLAASRAGRSEVRLLDPAPEVTVTTDPRSLARLVGHRVRAEDGVAAASVTADRRKVKVKAQSRFRSVGDLRDRVSKTAASAVGDLPLQRRPRVSVSVSPAKER
ncbi:DUF6286 domain-containing protein [Saccharopolyspora gloriosae]|uniref:DUF6286 domain-containing protein n=1 Tax=Saccharopolyspora gloriosae TaxID=455344 RepID=UPI001FB71659|nr:DUF6286 domain-containing protein [Saccharopolyspora gloriosae]